MGAYNAGRIPHQQHFYVDDEADAPTKAYVGDKLYIFNTNEQKIWDGEKWVEYGAIVSLSAQQTGKTLAEQYTQDDAEDDVLAFSENIRTISIYHEESTWKTFIVNGMSLTVPAGGWVQTIGGVPSKEVTIPSGVNCIVGRLV
mgnify:CR=1 FL=1|jgi:hypothetical protein